MRVKKKKRKNYAGNPSSASVRRGREKKKTFAKGEVVPEKSCGSEVTAARELSLRHSQKGEKKIRGGRSPT